jgi:hemerythrin-like domain-containing protein
MGEEALMQQPVQTLKDEHRLIERVLDSLDLFVESQLANPQEATQRDLLGFVEFIRSYADRIHHGKEEDILFERMVAGGYPRSSGPLAVMYHEHELGREFVRELDELGKHTGPWADGERRRLAAAGRGYTSLLRGHILKEDNVLYPMAESGLDSEAWSLIAERFDEFELGEKNSGEKARLASLAEQLMAKYEKRAA